MILASSLEGMQYGVMMLKEIASETTVLKWNRPCHIPFLKYHQNFFVVSLRNSEERRR